MDRLWGLQGAVHTSGENGAAGHPRGGGAPTERNPSGAEPQQSGARGKCSASQRLIKGRAVQEGKGGQRGPFTWLGAERLISKSSRRG